MNNSLQIFENTEFGSVRTVDIEGKIYFVANDVAKALGYVKPANAVMAHCKGILKTGIPSESTYLDADEKFMLNIGLSGGI